MLAQANLAGANLASADLEEADLGGAQAQRATLSRASLRDATLEEIDLTGATLERVVALEANFRGAKLVEVDLREADLSESDLSSAVLESADLRRAVLVDAKLAGAILTGAKIAGLDTGNQLTDEVVIEWADASPRGDGSRLLDIRQIRRMLANDGAPDGSEKRFFGPGDVLRNAELEFGDGANVHVESQLEGCAITLSNDADFVLGERGLMLGCVVTGGKLTLHGRFKQGDRTGLVGPRRLVASSTAIITSTIEQPETATEFAFERGCRLRVKIKKPAAQEKSR